MKTDRILTGLLIFTMVHWMGLSKVFAYNQAIYLNGTDNYVEIPHDDVFNLYDNMAITIWIKVTDFNTPYASIVTKGESSWAIQRYKNTDFIQVIYGEDSIVGTTSVNDGKWHHIAATYVTFTLKLYIDGELDASKSILDPYFSINENPVCIGTSPEHPERLFHGVVDELRIWKIYQAPEDIRAHMNVELTGSNWGLVAYYRMDNDYYNPSHIVDFTGHGHTGILQETWVTAYVNTGVIFAKAPKAGDGSAGNPYQIDSIGYLFWITRDTDRWNKHYVQTADIDASATESLYGGKGFLPAGDETVEFSGSYQGNDFNIDGLYINRPDKDSVGLFGNALGVDLNNILLTDADITGGNYVGGIAGIADDSSELNKCTFSGSLTGTDKVGAMAGMAGNGSTVQNCLNAGSVSGEDQVGGIVGDNISGTYIRRCCNQGTVSATGSDCGGVAGNNHSGSYVINSYSTGSVSGNDAAGGLVGNNSASVESCYSSGAVSATTSPGGLVGGSGSGTVSNSFWDTQSSGQANSNGGTGKTSSQMKDIDTYTIVNAPELTTAWDFVTNTNDDAAMAGIWNIDQTTVVNSGYPIMTWQAPLATEPAGNGIISEPYLVSNLNNLVWITENASAWEGFFEQVEDIPAGDTWGWEDRSGFLPIGNSTTAFDGHYNGDGYSIEDLFINRGSTERVGFFGNLDGAEIENLIITGADITGSNYTGVLAGYAAASDILYCGATGTVTAPQWAGGLGGYATVLTIQYCYADVDVTGESDDYLPGRIGGLVGYCNASSAVKNCYARGNIYGEYATGGLVGYLENSSVENSFSSGDVSTNGNDLGGLIGLNASSPVTNSFWDTQTSGHGSSAGGTGKTTAQMKRATTFLDAGWDFTLSGDIWAMNDSYNSGYPYFRWQGLSSAHIWLGSISTDWSTAGNWSENSIPNGKVIVPDATVTNKVILTSDTTTTITQLKIESNGDMTVQSASGGTELLIVTGSASGNVTLQRYLNVSTKSPK